MVPLIVQLVAWGTLWIIGTAGLAPTMAIPVEALRVAFAVMFVFTGVAHFVPRTRTDMLAMVPPTLPMPGLLVTATGALQLAGAAGLLLPTWSRWAAFALAALLVAMFPANIHASKAAGVIAGRPAMSVVPRLMLQLLWIAGLLWVAIGGVESRAR
jgi:uncharacterized membrane protein